MPWIDAFAPAEARYRAEVMADTWGHLAPRRNKKYKGRIVFAIGCFGNDPLNPVVLACDFDGLDSSPWFFEAVAGLVECRSGDAEIGRVYEWTGTFRNYRFDGAMKLLLETSAAPHASSGG